MLLIHTFLSIVHVLRLLGLELIDKEAPLEWLLRLATARFSFQFVLFGLFRIFFGLLELALLRPYYIHLLTIQCGSFYE